VPVTRFDRYVLSQMMVLFGFFALVLVSVYWVNRAVSLFDSLIADGQSARVFLEFTALTLPNVIRLVLPVAAFAASVYATNRMVIESEFVVMQATGLSGYRLARPVLMYGLVVALLMAALMHFLVPASRAQLIDRRAEIAENITARLLVDGAFLHAAPGVTIYIREITPEGALRDIFLSDGRGRGAATTYTAREALLVPTEDGPHLLMLEGLAQVVHGPDQRLSVTAFDTLSYDLAALIGPVGPREPGLREMGTPAILALDAAGLERARATEAEARLELHSRIAQPLMAPAAALIGFAALILGAFSRLGIWRQVIGAITVVIVMQLLHTAITGMVAREAALAGLVYLPPLFGFAAAGVLLWLAGRRRAPGSQLPWPLSVLTAPWRRRSAEESGAETAP
jgi:lipopolysaccharide export system permease protein